MENKYYIPEIEEFHIGFEFEQAYRDPEFEKKVITDRDCLYWTLNEIASEKDSEVRVKYLDNEDIKKLGWKPDGNDAEGDEKFYIFKDNISYYLHHDYNQTILITMYEDRKSKGQLFYGECNNKTELKKLMKQLNIQNGNQ